MRVVLLLLLLLLLLLTVPAHAYLDPGTGSILVQAILGAAALGAAVFRDRFARLLRFATGPRRKIKNEPAATRAKNDG